MGVASRLAMPIGGDHSAAKAIVPSAALGSSDDLRATTYATLFGLIASAGLRVSSEAIDLADSDADLDGAS